MEKYTNIIAAVVLAIGLVAAANALSGSAVGGSLGTISPTVFHSSVAQKAPVVDIAKTSIYSTTTLDAVDSGTIYNVSASGTTITLPAVGVEGTHYTFTIGGAVDTGNVIIDSAEGDNIEGTLLVAGAVVDCAAVDQINFVADGENVGDFVEVFSNGTNWIIGKSGGLTTAKITCTDPS